MGKTFFKLFIFSLFFTVVIFFINYNFFSDEQINIIEEKYIEPVLIKDDLLLEKTKLKKEKQKNILNEKYKKHFQNKDKKNINYNFYYNPVTFRGNIKNFLYIFSDTIKFKSFYNKINFLQLEFLENKIDVRGKMTDKKIKLFGITEEKKGEYLAIFIHEFGHYIDLYFLDKSVFSSDVSNKFYNISWISTKTKRADSNIGDFVSGYAMTNKYEDFAESFVYFVLHNNNFLEKSKKSLILEKKYYFLKNNIFKHKGFLNTNFGNKKRKDYYRDITKISYDLEKFMNYVK